MAFRAQPTEATIALRLPIWGVAVRLCVDFIQPRPHLADPGENGSFGFTVAPQIGGDAVEEAGDHSTHPATRAHITVPVNQPAMNSAT